MSLRFTHCFFLVLWWEFGRDSLSGPGVDVTRRGRERYSTASGAPADHISSTALDVGALATLVDSDLPASVISSVRASSGAWPQKRLAGSGLWKTTGSFAQLN
jgi:hypothetical protein